MQDSFWNAVFSAHEAGAMAEKYAFLREAVEEAGGPAASSVLREAARRWPGSLREHQRVEPGRYRAREGWARQGAGAADRARAAWLREGQAAICLWSELHRLTAEVLAWRSRWGAEGGRGPGAGEDRRARGAPGQPEARGRPGPGAGAHGAPGRPEARGRPGPAEFLRDLTLRDPERRAAWPEAAVLEALDRGGGLGPRVAEAWLAQRAGWSRAALRACLLDLEPA